MSAQEDEVLKKVVVCNMKSDEYYKFMDKLNKLVNAHNKGYTPALYVIANEHSPLYESEGVNSLVIKRLYTPDDNLLYKTIYVAPSWETLSTGVDNIFYIGRGSYDYDCEPYGIPINIADELTKITKEYLDSGDRDFKTYKIQLGTSNDGEYLYLSRLKMGMEQYVNSEYATPENGKSYFSILKDKEDDLYTNYLSFNDINYYLRNVSYRYPTDEEVKSFIDFMDRSKGESHLSPGFIFYVDNEDFANHKGIHFTGWVNDFHVEEQLNSWGI